VKEANPVKLTRRRGQPSRADASQWVLAAMDILAAHGVDALRVEQLAKSLGVTKGSFYWHFRDRDAFLEAILDTWRRRATLQIIDRLEQSGQSPKDRLAALLSLPYAGTKAEQAASVELAIRLWARTDARALRALAEVDTLRLRYFAQLFGAMGMTEQDAGIKSVVAYSYMRVAPSLPDYNAETSLVAMLDLLMP